MGIPNLTEVLRRLVDDESLVRSRWREDSTSPALLACVATLAIAGPAATLQQLAAPDQDGLQPDIRPALDAGIGHNCGPPYVVLPR
jgi:hypothetical protein